MSLRSRLFLLFGSLLFVLLGAQWWMLRSLAHDLDIEVEALAVAVGESIVEILQNEELEGGGGTSRTLQVHVTHRHDGEPRVPAPEGPPPAAPTSDAPVGPLPVTPPPEAPASPPPQHRETASSRTVRIISQKDASGLTEEGLFEWAEEELARIGEANTRHLKVLKRLDPGADALLVAGADSIDRIPIPMNSLEQRVQRFTNRMLAGTGALLLLGLLVAGLFAHGIARPLRQLAAAARQVGDGELGVRVDAAGTGEMKETLLAFNQMSDRLRKLEDDTRRLRAGQHLKELGEVSRGLAHSLRNPLNALGLSLDRLADDDLEASDRLQLASTARQQIRRVDGSLRSFLALASSGTVPEEDVDLAAVVQDVTLEALQDAHIVSGAGPTPRIETDIAPNLLPLRAVQPELRAVLQALVVNALEASPEGGRIRIKAAPTTAGGLRISVEDEGPGVSPEIRDRLFSPHVTTKEQGSGMGLFLAQRIATNHYGGSLRLIEANPESGSSPGTLAILEIGPRNSGIEEDR